MAAPKKSSKHVEIDVSNERDDLALALHKELNKAKKDGSPASFFLDDDKNPSQVSEWVSSGATLLDLAISSRPHGGFPVGRITELSGLEGTGKSLFCAQLIAETQKRGGLSVFFDSEFAVDREFWTKLGINIKNVNYVPFTTLEELFNNMELCIGAFRKANKNRLLTIFVDSIAQASTEVEMESEHGKDGYNTSKSIIIGKALRKITGLIAQQRILVVFTNQVRYNMNAGPFGEKWLTPCGKALPFASSCRVRLANIGKVKKDKDVLGIQCQAQVIKSRFGPNFRTAQFDILYDSGIQDIDSWLEFMKDHGITTGDRRGFVYKSKNGEEVKLNASEFTDRINSDPQFKEEVYLEICEKFLKKAPEEEGALEDLTAKAESPKSIPGIED